MILFIKTQAIEIKLISNICIDLIYRYYRENKRLDQGGLLLKSGIDFVVVIIIQILKMQFYNQSTARVDCEAKSLSSNFTAYSSEKNDRFTSFSSSSLESTLFQLQEVSHHLISSLLTNQKLIDQRSILLRLEQQQLSSSDPDRQSFSPISNIQSDIEEAPSHQQYQVLTGQVQKMQRSQTDDRNSQRLNGEQSYSPLDLHPQPHPTKLKRKIGKEIYQYIMKHPLETAKASKVIGLSVSKFDSFLKFNKRKLINTQVLNKLLSSSSDPSIDVYRILSSQYLSDHGLVEAFNSSVENVHNHIPYCQAEFEDLFNAKPNDK